MRFREFLNEVNLRKLKGPPAEYDSTTGPLDDSNYGDVSFKLNELLKNSVEIIYVDKIGKGKYPGTKQYRLTFEDDRGKRGSATIEGNPTKGNGFEDFILIDLKGSGKPINQDVFK